MFVLGEKIPAAELVISAAVRAAVPADELTATAVELARQLASKSPIALNSPKEAMNRVEGVPLRDTYRTEQDYTARLLGFEDERRGTPGLSREEGSELAMALTQPGRHPAPRSRRGHDGGIPRKSHRIPICLHDSCAWSAGWEWSYPR